MCSTSNSSCSDIPHCCAALGPQLPLRAESIRRLDQGNQQSSPNRTDARNLAKPFRPAVFSALRQEIASHFLAQCLQRVELLEELGSTAHAGFRNLVQPFRAMAWSIDGCAGARNGPASILAP